MLANGTYLANRYEILELIGQGGMSHVYKARDHVLGREVAIKVLKEEYAQDMTFLTKFRAEAQAAAGLEHPNIVNIYDVGTENGLYYIVMEYIDGVTLKTYIARKGRLNYKEVLSIAIQVARGIEAAHNKGIIHRDIKPQNIMISKDGKVKVTDFGIAKAVTSNTVHADMMGSVHYTSPEQARNGYVSFKSDIYSLGIVMYEMATGRVPFDGDSTVAIAIQHLQSEMVPPSQYAPDLPIAVERIIQKATMKSPDQRYQNMGEMLLDLRKALVTPDEDFVTIPPLPDDSDKTRVISEDELNQIKKEAGVVTVDDDDNPIASEESDDENVPDQMLEEDDDELETPKEKKVDKLITIAGIVAAIVIAVIVLVVLGNLFGWFGGKKHSSSSSIAASSDKGNITVTNVVGRTEEDATQRLKKQGFKVSVEQEASDTYEEGEVISQDPKAGSKASEGDTVTITVSSGSGEIAIPSVKGLKEDAAKKTLTDAGFDVDSKYEYSNSVANGVVISQDPDSTAKGKKGDTITITVSQGSQQVRVPSVTGQSQSAATSALQAVGLNVGNITSTYSDSVAEGNVVSQSKTQGQYVDPGTSVDLVISKGKETTYYSFSQNLTSVDNLTTVYTLSDSNGNTISSWTVNAGSNTTANASNITTSSGTLTYHTIDAEGNENPDQSRAVSFTEQ